MLLMYSAKHDCWFDQDQDVWFEGACADPKCSFCQKMPARPSQDKHLNAFFLAETEAEDPQKEVLEQNGHFGATFGQVAERGRFQANLRDCIAKGDLGDERMMLEARASSVIEGAKMIDDQRLKKLCGGKHADT